MVLRLVSLSSCLLVLSCLILSLRSQDIDGRYVQDFGEYQHRYKRSSDRHRACVLLIGIDEPLFDKHDRNMTAVVELAQDHVTELNNIYNNQVFNISGESDRYFRLGRVQVMFGTCDGFEKYNCTEKREEYLRAFDSHHDTSGFCLSYIFTYLDFHNDTAGLASIGTVCRPTQNSGFVTFLNNGQDAEFTQSALTFAHEVGHNFGALHDDEFEECKDKGFIMAGTSSSDSNKNGRNFSSCSLTKIHQILTNLTEKVNEIPDCFKDFVDDDKSPEVEVSLCGNFKVEPGEACDCGPDPLACNDPCCYPAHIDSTDRYYNESAAYCQTTAKSDCLHPKPIIYALYLPLFFIALSVTILFFVLNRDWKGQKKFFTHITQNDVRIVRTYS